MCRRRHARHGWRAPSREQLLAELEERQRDLEQEIADIHDLIRRLRDETTPPPRSEPQPAV
jgi:hypothetical protein